MINNNPKAFYFGGVKINELTLKKTVTIIQDWIKQKRREYIVLTGAHGIVEMQKDFKLKEINNLAGLVTPDGMPEVWIGKVKGCKNIEKVYAPDIMMGVFKISPQHKIKHFFYGGREGVAELLKDKMNKRFPGIEITGTYCPPFRNLNEEEKQEIIEQINNSKADIVWCGLGCPKQERWMHEFRPFLNASVLIGVGAGFDFLAGTKKLSPYWVSRSGFEWLYRLLNDPKYLFKRYNRVVPEFIFLTFRELISGKLFRE